MFNADTTPVMEEEDFPDIPPKVPTSPESPSPSEKPTPEEPAMPAPEAEVSDGGKKSSIGETIGKIISAPFVIIGAVISVVVKTAERVLLGKEGYNALQKADRDKKVVNDVKKDKDSKTDAKNLAQRVTDSLTGKQKNAPTVEREPSLLEAQAKSLLTPFTKKELAEFEKDKDNKALAALCEKEKWTLAKQGDDPSKFAVVTPLTIYHIDADSKKCSSVESLDVADKKAQLEIQQKECQLLGNVYPNIEKQLNDKQDLQSKSIKEIILVNIKNIEDIKKENEKIEDPTQKTQQEARFDIGKVSVQITNPEPGVFKIEGVVDGKSSFEESVTMGTDGKINIPEDVVAKIATYADTENGEHVAEEEAIKTEEIREDSDKGIDEIVSDNAVANPFTLPYLDGEIPEEELSEDSNRSL